MENNLYSKCIQCPRECKTNRDLENCGFCKESNDLKIATACLHFGEEPLITVFGGSGTIFITGCTLRCSFCQNYQISQQGMGSIVCKDEFVEMCLKLQDLGAENINIVTGSHQIPKLADYLASAKSKNLKIPITWNSSGYEKIESLELLHGIVDIWLPDYKTVNSIMSKELFAAEDYPTVAKKAIRWMVNNTPMEIIEVTKNGETKEKMVKGTIVRHLVLPGRIEDTKLTLDWLKKTCDGKACISLMSQYTPVNFNGSEEELTWRKKSLSSFQNRLVNSQEDKMLKNLIDDYEFEYLFYQDLSNDTSWLPDFNKIQPFSNSLAKPVWHFKEKFIDC